jgi:hypothetical protein
MLPDSLLIKAKDLLFRSWIRESGSLRSQFRALNTSIQGKLMPGAFTGEGDRMYKAQADRLERAIRRDMRSAFDAADREIQLAVERAASRAAVYQKKFLDASGVPILGNKELQLLQKEAVKILGEEFPKGSGLTYHDRLKVIRMRHEREMVASIRKSYRNGNAQESIRREMSLRLTNNKVGVRTRVSGGSVSKQVSRMMIAEEARISQETEKLILEAHDIELAYWRLSPDHKWEGSEICEVLASTVGPGVEAALRRSTSTSTSTVILEGLYLVSEWPDYPHPCCKCHMDPVV